MRLHLAADHAGFALKEKVKEQFATLGYEIIDHGATKLVAGDDYPAIMARAARAISETKGVEKGIFFGGSGQGEAIVANRFHDVRAVVYYADARARGNGEAVAMDMLEATRAHNDANVLSIGARFVLDGPAVCSAIERWIKTSFSGDERHKRRIGDIEREGARL